MNNRYKELSCLAFDHAVEKASNDAWIWEEKFAELIIQECINLSKNNNHALYSLEDVIRNHFGVK